MSNDMGVMSGHSAARAAVANQAIAIKKYTEKEELGKFHEHTVGTLRDAQARRTNLPSAPYMICDRICGSILCGGWRIASRRHVGATSFVFSLNNLLHLMWEIGANPANSALDDDLEQTKAQLADMLEAAKWAVNTGIEYNELLELGMKYFTNDMAPQQRHNIYVGLALVRNRCLVLADLLAANDPIAAAHDSSDERAGTICTLQTLINDMGGDKSNLAEGGDEIKNMVNFYMPRPITNLKREEAEFTKQLSEMVVPNVKRNLPQDAGAADAKLEKPPPFAKKMAEMRSNREMKEEPSSPLNAMLASVAGYATDETGKLLKKFREKEDAEIRHAREKDPQQRQYLHKAIKNLTNECVDGMNQYRLASQAMQRDNRINKSLARELATSYELCREHLCRKISAETRLAYIRSLAQDSPERATAIDKYGGEKELEGAIHVEDSSAKKKALQAQALCKQISSSSSMLLLDKIHLAAEAVATTYKALAEEQAGGKGMAAPGKAYASHVAAMEEYDSARTALQTDAVMEKKDSDELTHLYDSRLDILKNISAFEAKLEYNHSKAGSEGGGAEGANSEGSLRQRISYFAKQAEENAAELDALRKRIVE